MKKFSIVLLMSLTMLSCQGQNKNTNNQTTKTMDSRDELMNQILTTNDTTQVGDNSGKNILARGCDPEMGRRSLKVLPPLLGNPEMVSVYNDNDFIEQLKSKKWSVVFFAPGACRYNEAHLPIPGNIEFTKGWSLEEYRALVYQYQGKEVKIVETMDEQQIIPFLKNALENSITPIK